MLWPALSAGLVSSSYFLNTTAFFGKRHNGSRHPVAAILLAPYLVLAWCVWNLQILLSREPAWHAIGDKLIVARRLRSHELPEQVDVICDLTSELLDPQELRQHPGYQCHPMLDANGMSPDVLVSLVQSISPQNAGRLLIHCANGHGRTGLVAAAWLIATRRALSADNAMQMLRAERPGIKLRMRQRRILDAVEPLLRDADEKRP